MTMDKKKTIESLLFVADRSLNKQEIAKLTETTKQETEKYLKQLIEEYNQDSGRGIQIINNQNDYQMVTHPQSSKIIQRFLKKEVNSELSRPALETLAIISYRGPINKLELDQIRGVNCALILRNLMIRGLVEKMIVISSEYVNRRKWLLLHWIPILLTLEIIHLNSITVLLFCDFKSKINKIL